MISELISEFESNLSKINKELETASKEEIPLLKKQAEYFANCISELKSIPIIQSNLDFLEDTYEKTLSKTAILEYTKLFIKLNEIKEKFNLNPSTEEYDKKVIRM